MEFIGERISLVDRESLLTIVILPLKNRIKEFLLTFWCLAWTSCGIYFIIKLPSIGDPNQRLAFFILLSFWAYYEYLGVRALVWRKFGKEMIRLAEGKIMVKNAIKSFGTAKSYLTDNIESIEMLDEKEGSLKKIISGSYWSTGGEVIMIKCGRKKILLGKQLDLKEAKKFRDKLWKKVQELKTL